MISDVDASPLHRLGSQKQRGSEMPVSWKLVENCSGKVLRRSKNRVFVAGWRRVIGATVVPACILPSVGQHVRFGSFDWEVVRVEQVECDYDPSYLYRVDLVIRDESGKPVNFASGISNLCLDG